MKLRWAALTIVLALSVLMPSSARAQATGQSSQPPRRVAILKQNYPNPFNPETWIPFSVDQPCTDPGRQYRVTVRIYNLLAQVVAVPVLQGAGAGSVGGNPPPVENLSVGCGEYVAYWNGKYLGTTREAASGVYLYRLEVDGRVEAVKRFLVTK